MTFGGDPTLSLALTCSGDFTLSLALNCSGSASTTVPAVESYICVEFACVDCRCCCGVCFVDFELVGCWYIGLRSDLLEFNGYVCDLHVGPNSNPS